MKKMYDESDKHISRHLIRTQPFESIDDDDVESDCGVMKNLRGNNTDSGIEIEKDDLVARDGSCASRSEKIFNSQSRFDSARTDSGFESFPSEKFNSGDSSMWKTSSDIIHPLSPTEECDIFLTSPLESKFHGNIPSSVLTSLSSTKEDELKYLNSNYYSNFAPTLSSNTRDLEEQLKNLNVNDSQNRTYVPSATFLNYYQDPITTTTTTTTNNAFDNPFEDDEGDSVLHIAIIHGLIELVFRIIHCIDVFHSEFLNLQNNLLQTPLHLATITNQHLIVRKLVLAGALVDIRDRRGNTAIHIACERGFYNCALEILNSLKERSIFGNIKPDLELINYEGQTCMHLATLNQDIALIQLLANSGANINAQECKSGRSPLHYAVEVQNLKIVHLLANDFRADLNSRTFAGLTPIQFAYNRNKDIAETLIHLGADNIGLPFSDSESDSSSDETTKMDIFTDSKMDFCVNGQPLTKY